MKHTLQRFLATILVIAVFVGVAPGVFAAKTPFADAQSGWYAEAVEFVYEHMLMNGISTTSFAPNTHVSRAMVATVLFRIAGSPANSDTAPFHDLSANWYKAPVAWAAESGVVNGYPDGSFRPDADVTRQELVTMLWRFAGEPATQGDYLSAFADSSAHSAFAHDALNWAVAGGVINGDENGRLDAGGAATRAQLAAILMRFAGHTWDEGKITTQPTCTAGGERTYSCAYCEETTTDDMPALGHNYVAGVCTRCGDAVEGSPTEGDSYDFRLLFTSDLHGSFYDWRYSAGNAGAGMARIATAIEARRSGANRLGAGTLTADESEARTLLIDLGDTIQGNGTAIFHSADWDNDSRNTAKMYPLLYAMELLSYDVWVVGNHEFNFGMDRLGKSYGKDIHGEGKNGFTGAILGGNVFTNTAENIYNLPADTRIFDDFYVRQMPDGGPTVAVVGMTHSGITQWDAYNVLGAGLRTVPAAVETQKTIDYLQSAQAEAIYGEIDVFIGAMHISGGYGNDASYGIISANPELDLLLGAHGHNPTNDVSTGTRYMELPGNASGACLGQVDVTVTYKNGQWTVADRIDDVAYTAVNPGTTASASYKADPFLRGAHETAYNYSMQEVGTLSGGPLVALEPVRGVTAAADIFYTYDNALNHLFFDAFMYASNEYIARTPELAARGMQVTMAASCALGSSARNSLQTPGPITRADIGQIYNYDNNTLCIIELTGHQLKILAEFGFASGRSGGNVANQFISDVSSTSSYDRILIGGGITYTVDMTRPAWDRITDLRNADGTVFDLDGTYLLAANNHTTGSRFLADGDKYPGGGRLQALADSQKLRNPDGSLRYDAAYDNYGTYEAGMPIVHTFTAQEILTLDGADPINNGEGCTGMVADYILRKLGGNLTNAFTPNWRFDTSGAPSADWVLYNKALEIVNANIGIDYTGKGSAAATPANIRTKLASGAVQSLWDLYSANIDTLLAGQAACGVGNSAWAAFSDAMETAGSIIQASGTVSSPVAAVTAQAPAAVSALESALAGLSDQKSVTLFAPNYAAICAVR
ncbi:MAG: S-layer homology domain-containing protein [Oscillospiraceae bacterium]|jgi:2',3'-cyclic-nucleotide 2'-phosphodiesterase (5'-nucleotidase family)|nr:S-layer homology domain-containing protein [Oscillospiraceae bacterium]